MQKNGLHFNQMPLFEASNIEMQHSGTASPMAPIKAVC
jgi:hypothetical protein